MKKIKKLFLIMFTCLLSFIGLESVFAENYNGKLYEEYWGESGVNVFATDTTTGGMDYNGWMIKSTIDSKIYYCIEPEIALSGATEGTHNLIIGDSNIIGSSRLNQSTFKRIQLLAYYGYGYKDSTIDHTSKKWYGITQVMIWRTVRSDLNWTFKDSRYGTPNASLFSSEVAEMESLLSDYYKSPSIVNENIDMNIGETKTITDTNNVLKYYKLDYDSNIVNVVVEGNNIKITALKRGEIKLNFYLDEKVNVDSVLLQSNAFQDIIGRGAIDPTSFKIDVKISGGTLNIQKIDSATEKNIPQGDASFSGAQYEIFNSENKSVGIITTDDTGKGTISLEFGDYYVKEIIAPEGYKLSDEVYEITLNEDNLVVDLKVKEDVITGKALITKLKGGAGDPFVIEANASFDVINSNDKVVEKLVTNEKGMSIVSLPYGTYTIHQTSGSDNYVFIDDFKIELKEDKIYEFELKNLKLSTLEFTKTDFSTDAPLPNTLIEVYKNDDTLIYSGRTDENGNIKIEDLEIGKYYILEKEAPLYYQLNNEKMYFEIKENGSIIKTTMKDKRNEGTLEFTKTDFSTDAPLPNTLIEIYFSETNELVFSGRTDENGQIIIEGLIAGKYCMYEKEAPEGYSINLDAMCFELKENGEVVKTKMQDKKLEVVENPYTADNIFYFTSLGLISLSFLTYLIIKKIKNKKK